MVENGLHQLKEIERACAAQRREVKGLLKQVDALMNQWSQELEKLKGRSMKLSLVLMLLCILLTDGLSAWDCLLSALRLAFSIGARRQSKARPRSAHDFDGHLVGQETTQSLLKERGSAILNVPECKMQG